VDDHFDQLLAFLILAKVDRQRNLRKIRVGFGSGLDHDDAVSALQRFCPSRFDGVPAPARAFDFTGFHGQANRRSSFLTGNELYRKIRRSAQNSQRIVREVARSNRAHFCRTLQRQPSFCAIDATRLSERASEMIRRWRAKVEKFAHVELDTGLPQDLADGLTTGEVADGKTIRLGNFVDVIRGNHHPGAGHIIDDDRRVAGNVFGHSASDHASVGVEAAARRAADDDMHSLAFEK
jgi:hypothetical protein